MKRLTFLLIASFLLGACGQVVPTPPIIPEFFDIAPTPFIDLTSYPTAQAAIQAPNQTSNGFAVNVERAWMDGKNVNADVCYTLPDSSDWSIYAANLSYAGTVQDIYGTTLLSLQDATDGQPGRRCDTLTFVVPPDADLTNAVITIDSFGAVPREGEYCSVYMPKIQQALLERGIGIALECAAVDGVEKMTIASYPPEMTQQQAEEMVYSDEFFTVKGPWSFSFNLAQ
ncbi:MAG: hypothetical protein IT310_07320 [Anaerolineales bacterium]|nr:hypothetical protein [Anaerolineales bacterium]